MSNSGKEGLTQKHLLQFKIAILIPFCLLCALFCMCVLSRFSHVQLFMTPWTVAHQAPLSMVFSRQEYWSGLPFPPPGDLQADSLPSEPPGKSTVTTELSPDIVSCPVRQKLSLLRTAGLYHC